MSNTKLLQSVVEALKAKAVNVNETRPQSKGRQEEPTRIRDGENDQHRGDDSAFAFLSSTILRDASQKITTDMDNRVATLIGYGLLTDNKLSLDISNTRLNGGNRSEPETVVYDAMTFLGYHVVAIESYTEP